jgi:hypothetical protein
VLKLRAVGYLDIRNTLATYPSPPA